jgi:hypothetical protein
MCIAPKVPNMPDPAELPKPPPPLAPPEKTAEQLVVNPNATNTPRRQRAQRGLSPDLEALRIPLNLPRAGSAEGTNVP